MHSFKVNFWNQRVYINEKRQYSTNEILTHCLNLNIGNLEEIHAELSRLKHKLFLQEDVSLDFIEGYDDNAQRAQFLIHAVDELVRAIPLYANSFDTAWLTGDKLFDCLNAAYCGWQQSTDIEDMHPGDNEFGFCDDTEEHYSFYNTHFIPEFLDCADNDADFALELEKANKIIGAFFDRYLTFVGDLLRVKYAFADFLDNYINAAGRFQSEFEIATAYEKFMAGNSRRGKMYQRLNPAGAMQMSHAVLKNEQGRNMLCEAYSFDNLGAFLYLDFFNGLKIGYIPKRCSNCGQYFLLTGGKFSDYCERPLAEDDTKTCRDVGARKKYDEKCKTDPVWLTYNRAYKAHYARYMKKKMSVSEFERWSAYAVELRTKALSGELTFEKYTTLVKQ